LEFFENRVNLGLVVHPMRFPKPQLLLLSFFLLGLTSCQTTTTQTGPQSRDDSWRGTRSRSHNNEFRGAWVYDPRRYDPDDVVRTLKQSGFNAVFVRLSSAGAAYYPSAVLPKAPNTHIDYARAYAEAGRKYGVKVHAWRVCFMMHNATAANISVAIKRGEVMRDSNGRALRPTYNVPVRTPALNSNRELEKQAMVELVTKYPLDGVQFDYIRYFSPKVDYSATSRAAFERYYGSKVKNWPSDVSKGRLKAKYHQWRVSLINTLVRDVSSSIRTANPNAKISAAVWHSPDVAKRDYAQDWVTWVREGYLDFVVPMNYTVDAHKLQSWVSSQQRLVDQKIPLYAGLGSYMLNQPEQLYEQINLCREAGLSGYVLYNYDERLKMRFLPDIPNR
jgi:uncharacterized lipoprotein YddW (UPF0748 family)